VNDFLYSILIQQGQIVTGAANPWFRGDIGIKDDRIAKIGHIKRKHADQVIDARKLIVCPGFIDVHSHSDFIISILPSTESTLMQGVTTLITGNCGFSLAPTTPETNVLLRKGLSPFIPPEVHLEMPWRSFSTYLETESALDLAVNIGHLVGHGTIRIAVMGYENRDPNKQELQSMKRHAREAMQAGALGLSSGLIYPPGMFAQTPELIEIAHVVQEHGGIYASHIRGEGSTLLAALCEAIEIGKQTRIPVHIAHHKASGRTQWGQITQTLQLMETARAQGIDITCDQYPYTAGMTSMGTLLPPWTHEGGLSVLLNRLRSPDQRNRMKADMKEGIPGWENFVQDNEWSSIYVASVRSEKNRQWEGKNISEIAQAQAGDEFTVLFNLLLEEEGEVTIILFFMDENDVQRVLMHPLQMIGSDSWSVAPEGILSRGKPHPRFYGTFPRVLGKYVREQNMLTLEDAIRRMTAFPATRFGLKDRGLIGEGRWADITIFNPKTIIDQATYEAPHKYPLGIEYVIVNGRLAVDHGKLTGARSGQVLRRIASESTVAR
jgi:N-acyl-D-aspartate/D-glutamate deacylase